MKIRFLIAFRGYRIGQVIDPPAMLANEWIRQKVAILHDGQAATVQEPQPQPAKRRGRPPNVATA